MFSSSRTSVTPPSSDCSVHPLSDDETVRFIADGEYRTEFGTSHLHSVRIAVTIKSVDFTPILCFKVLFCLHLLEN